MEKEIVIEGANENNLKNVNLRIPRDKLIVFTGVSGSGKSTLVFDTIYAEGQRRFMESLSSYARQFLGQMKKSNVRHISGLSPTISVDQKTTNNNPRSTVGTVTEIYDYLRLLFANIGIPFCPKCHKQIKEQSVDEIVDKVLSFEEGSKVIIMSPVVRGEKGAQEKLFLSLRKSGYVRVNVDGITYDLDEEINLDKNKKHTIDVIVDRIKLKENINQRLTESVENAIKLSGSLVKININNEDYLFSDKFNCVECGFSYSEVSPRIFSFNNPYGACPDCAGLGYKKEINVDAVLKDRSKSVNQGVLNISGWNIDIGSVVGMFYQGLAKKYKFSLDTPFNELSKKVQDILLYGTDEAIEIDYETTGFSGKYKKVYEGLIPLIVRRYNSTTSEWMKSELNKYFIDTPCKTCKGKRLKEEALNVLISGKNISDVCDMSVSNILEFLNSLILTESEKKISKNILKELNSRLQFLINVGLDYLSLSRSSGTLSGGESQRIRLASQIGSGLVGVTYILDEPSIGLHQRDNKKLIDMMKGLRDLGNTVIVVEHDLETIESADYIVDVGLGAGEKGGEIVACGTLEDIKKSPTSITAKYLNGELKIQRTGRKKFGENGWLVLKGAKENNLKNVNVKIPIGCLTAVTGVSGSGKSSLINRCLLPAMSNKLGGAKMVEGKYSSIQNYECFDKVIDIDQSPIGRTPRSNPATYTGVWTYIRELFANTMEAKERGYKSSRFSFNVKGGRCENCEGDGVKKIEMYFLPDVYVTCDVCGGKRYNRETLEVKFKDKTIADVLDMTIDEAYLFFENIPRIKNKLQTLLDVGLGYIRLGQSATTLSGGEAQRVKLATELSKVSTGKTLYILDEPTTGLHIDDVQKLIHILDRLVEKGNTVVVIEHNVDFIKVADYIIDLGKEGGEKGGKIIAEGTPEQVRKNRESITGQYI